MCGRYALGIRPSFVRYQLQEHHMPVDEAPDDEDVRQTYNFAPGNHGLVYRADVPDYGARGRHGDTTEDGAATNGVEEPKETRYKLQSMKWGLVPFWTKRNPDYGTVMKTINARDDSLIENRGMWNTMKQKKRCVVVAQGFYEWLKKNGGKEKIPHYMKRKDGQLMCFAGLWDCVQYEGSDEKLYTYTIITTDSNKQLKFLHDRMPVILENGSDDIRTWLDPNRAEWSKELQALLKPYDGELECYPVSKEVGKVGNNSPAFIVPVASIENKNNIANFFSNAKVSAKGEAEKDEIKKEEVELENKGPDIVAHVDGEQRHTIEHTSTEDNAPIPGPKSPSHINLKREHETDSIEDDATEAKTAKLATATTAHVSRSKPAITRLGRKTRSATSNDTTSKGSAGRANDGSQRITQFFKG